MMRPIPHVARLTAAALLLTLAAVSTHAQDWAKSRLDASPRHHEYVTLKHDNRTVQAFVVYPEVKDKATVVVLIHEIFGLSDWAKEMADELAAKGFIVVAPDLLSRHGAEWRRIERVSRPGFDDQGCFGTGRGPGDGGSGCGCGLREEDSGGERESGDGGILLGRR